MSEFEALSDAFAREFVAQPGANVHGSLRIADLSANGRGRGVVATADIPADTELFTIPRSYVMSVDQSVLYTKYPQILDTLDVDSDEILPKPWLNLILVMLYDYFHISDSKWQAYWAILPTQFDTLMFWNDGELDELQASTVRNHIGKDKADRLFSDTLIPVIRRNDALFSASSLSNGELLNLCHRMGSLIMAYAFDMQMHSDSDDESGEDGWVEDHDAEVAMGMVPLADTLNADADFNAHVEHETDRLVVRSLRQINAGDEILNYYGPLPNSDLARRYGYTSALHARYDVVEISWNLVFKVLTEQLGRVDPSGKELEASFVLERESGEPDDTGRHTTDAEFKSFPEDLINQVTIFAARALEIDTEKPSSRDSKSLKVAFLRIMRQVIELRLKEYATSVDEDAAQLSMGGLSPRTRMAVEIRLGEKRLLGEAQQYLQSMLKKYDADGPEKRSNGPDTVRAKDTKKRRT